MQKYLILTLVITIVLISGGVIFINPKESSNPNALETTTSFNSLPANKFNQALISGGYELIDIRTIEEFNEGHLKNAKQSDFYKTQEFSAYLDSLDKNKKYLIYCRSGNRTNTALQIMKSKGFKNVSDLADGYNSWISNGFAIEN